MSGGINIGTNELPVVPEPIVQIKIIIMSDGSIIINGFPSSLNATIRILQDAEAVAIRHFVDLALNGQLNSEYNIVPKQELSDDSS